MMAFPGMLVGAAKEAGMLVPDDPENFDEERFPHFQVFCAVQLCRPILRPGEHFENARIIAAVPSTEIGKVTLAGLLARGISYAQ